MKLGVGLPTHFGNLLDRGGFLSWCSRVERAGFHSLVVHDRPNHESWDPLVALAAAGAVTERTRLVAGALLLPPREEAAVALQAAVVDVISAGRLELGLALGTRPDDYILFGRSFQGRGKRFEHQLERILALWSEATGKAEFGTGPGPAPVQRPYPPLWIGGYTDAAIDRAVRFGWGYLFGAPGAAYMAERVPRVRAAARQAGRSGFRLGGLAYVLPTDEPSELAAAERLLRRYYGELRRPFHDLVISGQRDTIVEGVRAYEDAGLDVLHLFPVTTDAGVVDTLAAWLLPPSESGFRWGEEASGG